MVRQRLRVLRQNEILLIVCTQTAIMMMGQGVITPILPIYAQSFGVSILMIGVLVASFGVARMIMDIPAGWLAEHLGRRRMLIAGALIAAASSLGMGLVTQFWHLVLLRFFLGVSSAIYVTTAQIALADLSTVGNRSQYLSLHQGSHQVGTSLGPALGGFLAQFLGLRAPFFAYSAIAFVAALWAYFRIPETSKPGNLEKHEKAVAGSSANPQAKEKELSLSVWRTLLLDPSFLLVALLAAGNFMTMSTTQQTLIPLYGTHRLGMSEGQLGITMSILGVTTLVTTFMAGWLSDRVGRKRIIVPGFIGVAFSITLLGLSGNVALFIGAAAMMGVSRGVGGSVPAAYAADIAPGGNFGATLGLYRTFADMGFVIGPIVLGWLADRTGSLSLPFFATSGFLFLTAVVFGLFARETVDRAGKKV